ncbi:MAG TPA: hypothetical protein VG755_03815 [Nannocystaceae bacterium]|nr:hypothetical protein [Nannocystaceae bacterium]
MLAWVLVGCGGDGAPGQGDGSSSSSGDDPSSTSPPTTTTAPTSGPEPTSDTSGTDGGTDDTTTGEPMPPMVVGPCADDPATPAGQTGTPTALRTWTSGSGISTMTIDGAGNRYVAGTFSAAITFDEMVFEPIADVGEDATSSDSFVAALAPDGALLWLHHFHGDGFGVRPITLVLDAGDFLYLGGEFASSLWIDDMERGNWPTTGRNAVIAKFTASNGEVRWIRPLTSTENEAMFTGIVPTSSGNVIATVEWQNGLWSLNDTAAIASGGGTAWVGLDGNGAASWWMQGVWGEGTSWLGNASMRATEGGAIATFWTEAIEGMTTSVHVDGHDLSNPTRYTSYIVDIGDDGEVRTAEAFHTEGNVIIQDAITAPCGDLVAVGVWSGPADFGTGPIGSEGAFVWRRDPDGNTRWVAAEAGDHDFQRVAIDANGQVTVAGADGNIGRATRWSAAGEPLWNAVVDSGADFGYPNAVAIAPDGTAVLGGSFRALAIPGFDPVESTDPPGAYMIDLAP